METEKFAVIGLVIIIVVALGIFYLASENFFTEKVTISGEIAAGDCVEVNYIGSFEINNTIFDTSYEDVANDSGIYNELRTYEPLKIFVNPDGDLTVPEDYSDFTSSMIPGFINGLIGMEEGETNTVVIQPEDAYGIWNESMAILYGMDMYPLDNPINKTQIENITQFQASFPDVELTVGNNFDYGEIAFEVAGVLNATILEISDGNITYKLLPENGSSVLLPMFNWIVDFIINNETHFTMHSNIPKGHTFTISSYFGNMHFKALEVNDTHAKFAMNVGSPELQFVDQTLIFELTVEKVYKTSIQ